MKGESEPIRWATSADMMRWFWYGVLIAPAYWALPLYLAWVLLDRAGVFK